jgi:hypothetical protein
MREGFACPGGRSSATLSERVARSQRLTELAPPFDSACSHVPRSACGSLPRIACPGRSRRRAVATATQSLAQPGCPTDHNLSPITNPPPSPRLGRVLHPLRSGARMRAGARPWQWGRSWCRCWRRCRSRRRRRCNSRRRSRGRRWLRL